MPAVPCGAFFMVLCGICFAWLCDKWDAPYCVYGISTHLYVLPSFFMLYGIYAGVPLGNANAPSISLGWPQTAMYVLPWIWKWGAEADEEHKPSNLRACMLACLFRLRGEEHQLIVALMTSGEMLADASNAHMLRLLCWENMATSRQVCVCVRKSLWSKCFGAYAFDACVNVYFCTLASNGPILHRRFNQKALWRPATLMEPEPENLMELCHATCAQSHTHTHARAHAHAHTHTHARTHTHMCAPACAAACLHTMLCPAGLVPSENNHGCIWALQPASLRFLLSPESRLEAWSCFCVVARFLQLCMQACLMMPLLLDKTRSALACKHLACSWTCFSLLCLSKEKVERRHSEGETQTLRVKRRHSEDVGRGGGHPQRPSDKNEHAEQNRDGSSISWVATRKFCHWPDSSSRADRAQMGHPSMRGRYLHSFRPLIGMDTNGNEHACVPV
eukprot:1150819-Pelagomonas_calceolata.AAC.6